MQVSGRVLVPGAAMLEAALAAIRTLTDGHNAAALTTVAIPAPLMLPHLRPQHLPTPNLAFSMCVNVSAVSGDIGMESMAATVNQWTTHLRGSAAQLLSAVVYKTRSVAPPASGPVLVGAATKNWPLHGPIGQVDESSQAEPAFRCHPAAVDSSMHLAMYLGQADGRTRIPGTLYCIMSLLFCL